MMERDIYPLQRRHNGHDGVSNHQPHDCLLNRIFGRRSKKTSKLRVTGRCAGNSPVTGEFPAPRATNAKNVFIWWRHHVLFNFRHIGYLLICFAVTDLLRSRICSSKRKCYLGSHGSCCSTTLSVTQRLLLLKICPSPGYVYKALRHVTF